MIKTVRCTHCNKTFGKGEGESNRCPYCKMDATTISIYPKDVTDAMQKLIDIADAYRINVTELVDSFIGPK